MKINADPEHKPCNNDHQQRQGGKSGRFGMKGAPVVILRKLLLLDPGQVSCNCAAPCCSCCRSSSEQNNPGRQIGLQTIVHPVRSLRHVTSRRPQSGRDARRLGLRQRQSRHQLANAQLVTIRQERQDAPAIGIGQDDKEGIESKHDFIYAVFCIHCRTTH